LSVGGGARRIPGRRSATVVRRIGAEAHRLLLPQSVHRLGGIVADLLAGALAQRAQVELAVGVLDQYPETHGIRAFALAGARGQARTSAVRGKRVLVVL